MDGLPDNLPTDSDALVALLLQQQQRHEQQLSDSQERNKQLQKNVQTKTLKIEKTNGVRSCDATSAMV